MLTDMRAVHKTLESKGITKEFERRGGVRYLKRLWSAERVSHLYTWQKFFFTQVTSSLTKLLPCPLIDLNPWLNSRSQHLTGASTPEPPLSTLRMWSLTCLIHFACSGCR